MTAPAPRTRAEARATETPNRWIPSPNVRLWIFGILVALSPLGVAYGVITAEQGGLWLSLASAILGVSNSIAARNVPRS